MKFKSILLALCLTVTGFCMAADSIPAAGTVNQAQITETSSSMLLADANSTKPQEKTKKGSTAGAWIQMLLPIFLVVVMIFIFSRSNKKQQQKRQEMLDRIVKGTRVMLNSGVYGKVSEVRENEFLVEIAEGVKVLVIKNGVASVEEEEEEKKSEEAK